MGIDILRHILRSKPWNGPRAGTTCAALTYYRLPDPKSAFRVAADQYIRGLQQHGIVVQAKDLEFRRFTLQDRSASSPIAIVHPLFYYLQWHGLDFADIIGCLKQRHRFVLGMEVADASRISARFVAWANHPGVDGIALPSRYSLNAFRNSGVLTSLSLVPHGVSSTTPSLRFANWREQKRPVILVFAVHSPERKGWDLVREIMPEFPDCLFVIKTTRPGKVYFQGHPNVVFIEEWLSPADLASLYESADILLSLHRGGAFELHCAEALAHGLPVAATRYGGVLDYLHDENAWLVDITGEDTLYKERRDDNCGLGAVPDLSHARSQLRRILADPEARRRAKEYSVKVRENLSWTAASQQLIDFVHAKTGGDASIARAPASITSRELRIAYHGPVFDSTGYGSAARAYIHALHEAGVNVAVQEVSTIPGRAVRCALTESLLAEPGQVDFHVFHGVPPIWARRASSLPNAIAMLVWETDRIPVSWGKPLRQAADVWVPCEFNRAAFQEGLGHPPFCLPHPLLPKSSDWPAEKRSSFLGVSDDEFVIYAIFDWQDRKCPESVLRAYLKAFDSHDRTVLVIKTSERSAQAAHHTLARAREEMRSAGRVELRCESWDEASIAALHQRGDCYLSLHRGEGWCYPLFDAVSQGKAAVATGYSGPLDYLDREAHHLVRYRLTPVRQEYTHYNSKMLWAEPDWTHAAECLRSVFENQSTFAEKTAAAANRISSRFSPAEVGRQAVERLRYLLLSR